MENYSYIYATGNFSSKLCVIFDYPSNYYTDTTEGSPIITTVIELFNHDQLTLVANAFGITDSNDFNQHHIQPENIDHNALRESLQAIGYSGEEANGLVDRLKVLVSSKFEFVLCLANGELN